MFMSAKKRMKASAAMKRADAYQQASQLINTVSSTTNRIEMLDAYVDQWHLQSARYDPMFEDLDEFSGAADKIAARTPVDNVDRPMTDDGLSYEVPAAELHAMQAALDEAWKLCQWMYNVNIAPSVYAELLDSILEVDERGQNVDVAIRGLAAMRKALAVS